MSPDGVSPLRDRSCSRHVRPLFTSTPRPGLRSVRGRSRGCLGRRDPRPGGEAVDKRWDRLSRHFLGGLEPLRVPGWCNYGCEARGRSGHDLRNCLTQRTPGHVKNPLRRCFSYLNGLSTAPVRVSLSVATNIYLRDSIVNRQRKLSM
jgi:hypothetical protein